MEVGWSDRADAVAYMLENARLVASTVQPFDEAETRAFIERDFDRSGGFLNATSHNVLFEISDGWQDRLHEMKVPLLVIHGTADPVFPVEHGAAVATAVEGAGLVEIEGGGHALHPADWDKIISAIIKCTSTHPNEWSRPTRSSHQPSSSGDKPCPSFVFMLSGLRSMDTAPGPTKASIIRWAGAERRCTNGFCLPAPFSGCRAKRDN